jgi:trigger factor
VIGSGSFIPGFEQELIGAKSGDEVAFDITFPKDYHSDEFKGRKVHFVANIEKVEKPHTPEFTPEFIEKLRGVKTDMAGFREIIRKEIIAKKEQETRNKDEDTLMKSILEISTFEVGPSLLQSEIDQITREHAANLEQQGLSLKLCTSNTSRNQKNQLQVMMSSSLRLSVDSRQNSSSARFVNSKGVEATDEGSEGRSRESYRTIRYSAEVVDSTP